MSAAPYRLSELGWLQFERLSELVVTLGGDGRALDWEGRADRGRVAELRRGERLIVGPLALTGPLTLLALWTRAGNAPAQELPAGAVDHLVRVMERIGPERFGPLVVVSNLDEKLVKAAYAAVPDFYGGLAEVIGARRLSAQLDRDPEVRAALPSVLGVREPGPLIAAAVLARSSFDVSATGQLARVFWSTAAYARAREVLERHRFVVLTGPPEMGKRAGALDAHHGDGHLLPRAGGRAPPDPHRAAGRAGGHDR